MFQPLGIVVSPPTDGCTSGWFPSDVEGPKSLGVVFYFKSIDLPPQRQRGFLCFRAVSCRRDPYCRILQDTLRYSLKGLIAFYRSSVTRRHKYRDTDCTRNTDITDIGGMILYPWGEYTSLVGVYTTPGIRLSEMNYVSQSFKRLKRYLSQ